MAMKPFFQVSPHVAIPETRTLNIRGSELLPDGEYAFIEFFCDDPKCDCRRVLIQVWTQKTGQKPWATISYGWEDEAYYSKSAGAKNADMKGPILDPINPQSEYAEILLEFFKQFVSDKDYVERLKRHYEMFRKGLGKGRR